ncbi:MAG: hypothetical protein JW808_04205 [Victivallales bacterium]|nr:hypothetical protein [Victivallales bacterium]
MLNFFHIARNTFRECLREPIFFILLTSAITLIGLFPSLSLFVFREQIKLVIDSSMATTLVFGLVAAVLCASNTIHREIRNGTVLSLLSKPVSRWNFIIAKMAGILAALSVFVFSCNAATVISIRVANDQFQLDFITFYTYYGMIGICSLWGAFRNFYSRKSFPASSIASMLLIIPAFVLFLQIMPLDGKLLPFPWEVVPALVLLFFAVWSMGAITVMLSARLDMMTNLCASSALFFAGLVSDYFLAGSEATLSLSAVLYAVIPNWQFFWMADALSSKTPIPWVYVGWSAVYISLYMTLCAMIAIHLFIDKEVAENVARN